MGSATAARALPTAWARLAADDRRTQAIAKRIREAATSAPAAEPAVSASVAGLHYVDDTTMSGIRRIGKRRYVDSRGRRVSRRDVLARIAALAVPPAWRDVWICPDALGHLQATGRDARGRKQYRYHPRWRQVRDEVKYGRLLAFAKALPGIHERTAADLRRQGLPREKVLAAVVQLLEKTLIRVGNDEYARDNDSYGLTTFHDRHAKVFGDSVRFEFRGKSGIKHSVDLHDARLARIVRRCQELPGHTLFQYLDGERRRQTVGSADVNGYLRSISGADFTAKDFRTWAGTVLAARALAEVASFTSQRQARRNILRAIESVAGRLGNTTAVCRKSYIHPALLDAYMDGEKVAPVASAARNGATALAPIEAAVVRIIRRRIQAPSA
jgi:DNA topoisomerase-1